MTEYLLVILSSKLLRYFAKAFICNTVDFSTDYFKHLPIVVPSIAQYKEAKEICMKAVQLKQQAKEGDSITAQVEAMVEPFVNKIYGLDEQEALEVETWFKRRYPLFGRGRDQESDSSDPTNSATPVNVRKAKQS